MSLPSLTWTGEDALVRDLGVAVRHAQSQPEGEAAFESIFSGKPIARGYLTVLLGRDWTPDLVRLGLASVDRDSVRFLYSGKIVAGKLLVSDLPRKHFLNEELYVDPMWEAPAFARMLITTRAAVGLDMGCGCGVLALALSDFCDKVFACDVNPRALEIAEFNAALNGVTNVTFLKSDLFSAFEPDQTFDRIVFNAPVGMEFAPRHMLEAGEVILDRFFAEVPTRLSPGGTVQSNVCVKDWKNETFFSRLDRQLGSSARGFHYVFMELWRMTSGPRFWSICAIGTLRQKRNCFECTAIRRGWLTLRRSPGASSWVLPTNYHTWVHDAPLHAPGKLIEAALEISSGGAGAPRASLFKGELLTNPEKIDRTGKRLADKSSTLAGRIAAAAGVLLMFIIVAYAVSE